MFTTALTSVFKKEALLHYLGASNVKLIIELPATVEVTMVCHHLNLNRVREASYTERE